MFSINKNKNIKLSKNIKKHTKLKHIITDYSKESTKHVSNSSQINLIENTNKSKVIILILLIIYKV